jgi:hypothetical protein
MKHRILAFAVVLAALGSIAAGVGTLASGAKLPKCAEVKCRDLGCPADTLCVSGTKVKTCADVCNGH